MFCLCWQMLVAQKHFGLLQTVEDIQDGVRNRAYNYQSLAMYVGLWTMETIDADLTGLQILLR